MPIAHANSNPPELRIVRRRTVDLDPSAAQLVKDAAPQPLKQRGTTTHAHLWGMLVALAVVIWLAFTLLPRAH